MAGRALTVISRSVFLVCGLATLLTGVPYAILRGADLPIEREWVLFAVALGLLGGFSVVVALLPRSWIAKACKLERGDQHIFSTPLNVLGGFAAIFYLFAVGADFAPRTWELNPQIMLALCPMYILKMTFDPSAVLVFFLLAPMNAAVYGSLGLTLGYMRLFFRRSA